MYKVRSEKKEKDSITIWTTHHKELSLAIKRYSSDIKDGCSSRVEDMSNGEILIEKEAKNFSIQKCISKLLGLDG